MAEESQPGFRTNGETPCKSSPFQRKAESGQDPSVVDHVVFPFETGDHITLDQPHNTENTDTQGPLNAYAVRLKQRLSTNGYGPILSVHSRNDNATPSPKLMRYGKIVVFPCTSAIGTSSSLIWNPVNDTVCVSSEDGIRLMKMWGNVSMDILGLNAWGHYKRRKTLASEVNPSLAGKMKIGTKTEDDGGGGEESKTAATPNVDASDAGGNIGDAVEENILPLVKMEIFTKDSAASCVPVMTIQQARTQYSWDIRERKWATHATHWAIDFPLGAEFIWVVGEQTIQCLSRSAGVDTSSSTEPAVAAKQILDRVAGQNPNDPMTLYSGWKKMLKLNHYAEGDKDLFTQNVPKCMALLKCKYKDVLSIVYGGYKFLNAILVDSSCEQVLNTTSSFDYDVSAICATAQSASLIMVGTQTGRILLMSVDIQYNQAAKSWRQKLEVVDSLDTVGVPAVSHIVSLARRKETEQFAVSSGSALYLVQLITNPDDHRATITSRVAPAKHRGLITCLHVLPNFGTQNKSTTIVLVTACAAGTIRLWKIMLGEHSSFHLFASIHSIDGPIQGLCSSPNGLLLVAQHSFGDIELVSRNRNKIAKDSPKIESTLVAYNLHDLICCDLYSSMRCLHDCLIQYVLVDENKDHRVENPNMSLLDDGMVLGYLPLAGYDLEQCILVPKLREEPNAWQFVSLLLAYSECMPEHVLGDSRSKFQRLIEHQDDPQTCHDFLAECRDWCRDLADKCTKDDFAIRLVRACVWLCARLCYHLDQLCETTFSEGQEGTDSESTREDLDFIFAWFQVRLLILDGQRRLESQVFENHADIRSRLSFLVESKFSDPPRRSRQEQYCCACPALSKYQRDTPSLVWDGQRPLLMHTLCGHGEQVLRCCISLAILDASKPTRVCEQCQVFEHESTFEIIASQAKATSGLAMLKLCPICFQPMQLIDEVFRN